MYKISNRILGESLDGIILGSSYLNKCLEKLQDELHLFTKQNESRELLSTTKIFEAQISVDFEIDLQ